MENGSNKPLAQEIKNQERPAPSIIPEGQFRFEPIAEMFETPDTKFNDYLMSSSLAADDFSGVNQYKTDIDRYGIDAMASLGVAIPSFATDTYNPVSQNVPDRKLNAGSIIDRLSDLESKPFYEKRLSPIFSGMRQNQFLRYYNHPEFDKLGYSPYSNMENYYNANSTIWDDFSRMGGQWMSLAGTGLNSVYGSMFSGGDYFQPDTESATEFEDIMGIGSSTRGGVGGFINNLAANSAYTGGILASIAIEELILAGGAALSGGTLTGAAMAKTAANAARGVKSLFSFTKLFDRTRKILEKAKQIDTARDFYNASVTGGKMVVNTLGKGFTPNTVKAFQNMKTAQNAGQNMSNLAKMGTGFGGFYRDIRAVNLAMAESKLESGMVYNKVMQQGLTDANNFSGGQGITDGRDVANAANQAAFKTMLANAPLIYASNWFVIGNALGGFQRGIQRSLGSTFQSGVNKNIINTAGKKVINGAGEVIKNPFKYIGPGFKSTVAKVKAGGVAGLAGSGGMAMLNYFAANVAEGIQEIGQEAISAATTGYYTEILNNPAQGGEALKNQMILSAMGDQFSSQGAGTFLSGFLMGGLVSGPQKLFFQGVPSIYKFGLQEAGIGLASKSQKEAYSEYKTNRETMINKVVDSYNKSWNSQAVDPSSLFDLNRLNFMVQKELAENIKSGLEIFGHVDNADRAKFQQYYTMFAGNGSYHFKNQLRGFLELSDAELSQAFPGVSNKDKKDGKLRGRINDMLVGIDKMEESYNKNKDKYKNPFDRSKFNPKTQQRQYVDEMLNEEAYEHVRYLYMFTNDGFTRALERADGIYSKLQSDPLFDKMSANDITSLLDEKSIQNEIDMLNLEVIATKGATQGIGESNKTKREKIKRLQAIQKIISDPQNRFKNGTFKRNKLLKGKLRNEFRNYVRFMASTEGTFADESKIDAALEQIVDYGALKGRARVYDKAIQYMQNPEKFSEIQQRAYEVNKEIYNQRSKITESMVKQYVDIVEANELINQLGKIGVYAATGETQMFLQTGNAAFLQTFYDDNGRVQPEVHTILYKQIQDYLTDYKETRAEQDKKDNPQTEEEIAIEESEETRSSLDLLLEKSGIDIKINASTNSPLLVKALERSYKSYRAKQARLGLPILDSTNWMSSAEAINIRNVINAIKKVWASGQSEIGVEGILEFNNPLESDVIKGDIGFEEFLLDSEVLINNPIITSILNQSGVDMADIVESPDVKLEEGQALENTPQIKFYKAGVIADVYKISVVEKDTEEIVENYKFLDKKGNELSKDIIEFLDTNFGSILASFNANEVKKVTNALDALNKNLVDSSTSFDFDGVSGLTYGQVIYKDGIKYIIVQDPLSSKKYGENQKLKIIKESDNIGPIAERKVLFISQGEFKDKFTLEETTFNLIPDSVTKIQIQDLTTLYPHVNYTEGSTESDNVNAKERYNAILSMLTAKEIEGLQLVVTLDSQGGTNTGSYAVKNRAGKVYKEGNPLIDRLRSKYIVGIRIQSPELAASINERLEEMGIEPSNSPEGVFAYLNNESFLIRDQRTGNPIDPRSMTREQASNVILAQKNLNAEQKQQALERVHNAFALNALVVQTFDNLNIDEDVTYIMANSKDLPFGLNLTPGGGQVAYAKSRERVYPLSMDELQYSTADQEGNLFVFDLKYDRKTGRRIYDFSTNLKGEERNSLENAIEAQLKKQDQWDNLLKAGKGTDRYLAMVRLPNGTYVKVNLTPRKLTKEDLEGEVVKNKKTGEAELVTTGIYRDIVEAARRIGNIKDQEKGIEEADKFNKELSEKLFLSSFPGNLIEINVSPSGTIYISFDNKDANISLDIGLTTEEVNVTDKSAKDLIDDLVAKFNLNADVEKYNATLEVKNFRASFAKNVSPQEIYDNTTTEVLKQVVRKQTVEISASSDALQLSRDIAFIPNTDKSNELEIESALGRDKPTAAEAEYSVSDMEESEFEEMIDENNFGDYKENIEHVVNAILRGIELSSREKQLMKNDVFSQSVILQVTKQGGPGSLAIEKNKKTTKLDAVKAELESLRVKLEEGLTNKRDKALAIMNSKEYQDLLAKRKKIERGANKLVQASSEAERIDDYNEFLDWASDNLPDIIGIEDLITLADNGISKGYERVGSFVLNLDRIANGVDVNGTIYTSPLSPYKYHEAFHSIFRTVLTQEQIDRYRRIAKPEVKAKYGSKYKTELEKFRNSAQQYQDMSDIELENEFIEEYMADEFEAFKKNPRSSKTNTEIKSFFTKLIEWIKGVLSKYSSMELLTLYENIDAGKFKNAPIQLNEFTQLENSLGGSISVANALVRYDTASKVVEKGEPVGQLYVDSDVIDPLIRSMAGMFINRVKELSLTGDDYSSSDIYDDLSLDFIVMLDPDGEANKGFSGVKKEYLKQLNDAFTNYPEDIKKEVFNLINIISGMDQANQLKIENIEDASGIRTTSDFNKAVSEIGGFNSLSYKVRSYIATTTMVGTDFFGKTELTEGEPLIVPVKFNEAYTALLKSVSNESNAAIMLKRMYSYSRLNPQGKAVVDKLFNDTGLTIEALTSSEPFKDVTDGSLLISILKGFENYKVDYLFNERDSDGNLLVYTASERDDINAQLDEWSQAYITKRKLAVANPEKVKNFLRLTKDMKEVMTSYPEDTSMVYQKSREFSERMFDLIGIRLSPNYIAYSIAKVKTEEDLADSPELKALKDGYTDESITDELLDQLYEGLSTNSDIFSTKEDGMASRLTKLSLANAKMDETIGASTFVNPNGDIVYGHQLPTFHLKTMAALNNQAKINELLNDEFLSNNYLLKNEAFLNLSRENRLKIIRVAGSKIKEKITAADNDQITEDLLNESISGNKATQSFGEFTAQEFAISLINNYTSNFNRRTGVVETVNGKDEQKVALSPVFLRVMEAANTGDLASLPVIKAVTNKNGNIVLTAEAVNTFVNSIEAEFNRISAELLAFETEPGNIEGFNNEKSNRADKGRAFKFTNNDLLLSETTKKALIEVATEKAKLGETVSLKEAILLATGVTSSSMRAELNDSLENSFKDFMDLLTSLNVKNNLSTQVLKGLDASNSGSKPNVNLSMLKLNLTTDSTYNLKQIFFNNYINSKALNDLFLGDQAISLKSMVDKVKRAKLQNAAYYSAYSEIIDPSKGITHASTNFDLYPFQDPIAKSDFTGNDIELADAQVYITTKGIRYSTFGFGRLSPAMAAMLDTIDKGDTISADRAWGSKEGSINLSKQQDFINSKKFVYMDGKTALKMSVTVLTKEYTSKYNKDTGIWEAKPNMKQLHYLREQMEANEEVNQNFAMAAPTSAMKMLKQGVNSLTSNQFDITDDLNSINLDTSYLGLQVINPSNKTVITDLNQIKELITSEQDDNVKVFIKGSPELDTVGKVKEAYNKAVSERVILKYKNKRNLVFSFDTALDEFELSKEKGSITPNLAAFLLEAQQGLMASGATSNLLEFFAVEDGVQKYNLNSPVTAKKFEQLFLTYFSKGTLREKVPGTSVALLSSFGHKVYRRVYEMENGMPSRSEIVRESAYNGEGLEDINNLIDGKYDGVLVLDVLRTGVMEYKNDDVVNGEPTGIRYSESIMPAMDKNIMELIQENPNASIPPVIAKMFGVRIPTQDKHSAINIRIVDFMPVYYGSTAIFPKELVEISGADFDIDKVYALTKEYYLDGNKNFRTYGNGDGNSYFEYVKYMNLKSSEPNNIFSKASSLYKDKTLAIRRSNALTEEEKNIVTDDKAVNKISEEALRAMLILGLPVTKAQFKSYVEKHGSPNEAVLNNNILDYRYTLAGNTGVTGKTLKSIDQDNGEGKSDLPIAYQAADLKMLEDLFDELSEIEGIELFASRKDSDVDVDTLHGMVRAFEANKGAAIGAIVKPNVALSLLREYKIKLKRPIKFDGNEYDGFTKSKINGERIQDIISTLVTMETDNAKERLIAKFGLNKHAVGLVGNMVSLGIPLRTSILLVNSAEIRELYNLALYKKNKYDASLETLLSQRINSTASLVAKEKKSGNKIPFVKLSDKFLETAVDSTQDLTNNEKLQILFLFNRLNKINKFTVEINNVTSLTQGLPQSIPEMKNSIEKITSLFDESAPVNVRSIYGKKSKTWQSTYLKIFGQIHNDLLPNTILTMSKDFNDILKPTYSQMDTNKKSFDNDVRNGIEQDLLSYLTIKSYQHLLNNSSGNSSVENTLLYPGVVGVTDLSLVKRIEDLRTDRAIKGKEYNYFLDSFVGTQYAGAEGNNTGMNIVKADTWRRLNEANKLDLQTSFAKLYGSLETREIAEDILHYMMIKDGLQLKYGSLMSAMSPFIMNKYLKNVGSVEAALKGQVEFESVFGISKEEVMKDFKYGYLQSNIVGPLLFTYDASILDEGFTFDPVSRPNKFNITSEIFDHVNAKELIRVKVDKGRGEEYVLFRILAKEDPYSAVTVYSEVPSMGSNQQFGGGFVGGPRLTYNQVRMIGKGTTQNSLPKERTAQGTQPASQTSEVGVEVTNEKYSRNSLDNDSSSMYLFTDNAERTSRPTASSPNITEGWYAEKYKDKTNKPLHYGSTSNPTSAVIRGKNNAYPISTMSAYGTNWTNENFDLFKDTIDDEIAQIKQDLSKFKTLKLGDFRIGQGGRFAKLPSQHQSYLDFKLLELGIDNSGNSPKVIKPTQQTSEVEYPVDTNPAAIQDVNEVLNSPSAIVNQTTDSVTVKADVDAAETNIADMAQIMAELSKNSDSLIFDESGNAIIEDTDMSIPEATEAQQQEREQLELDLFSSEEISEAPSLSEWWDANVEGNSAALEKLSGENIKTLDDAIALYGDLFSQTEQGEQDIIERLKCLI